MKNAGCLGNLAKQRVALQAQAGNRLKPNIHASLTQDNAVFLCLNGRVGQKGGDEPLH